MRLIKVSAYNWLYAMKVKKAGGSFRTAPWRFSCVSAVKLLVGMHSGRSSLAIRNECLNESKTAVVEKGWKEGGEANYELD